MNITDKILIKRQQNAARYRLFYQRQNKLYEQYLKENNVDKLRGKFAENNIVRKGI